MQKQINYTTAIVSYSHSPAVTIVNVGCPVFCTHVQPLQSVDGLRLWTNVFDVGDNKKRSISQKAVAGNCLVSGYIKG